MSFSNLDLRLSLFFNPIFYSIIEFAVNKVNSINSTEVLVILIYDQSLPLIIYGLILIIFLLFFIFIIKDEEEEEKKEKE